MAQALASRLGYLPTVAAQALEFFQVHIQSSVPDGILFLLLDIIY